MNLLYTKKEKKTYKLYREVFDTIFPLVGIAAFSDQNYRCNQTTNRCLLRCEEETWHFLT